MDSAVDPMIQALRRKLGGNRSLRGVDCVFMSPLIR